MKFTRRKIQFWSVDANAWGVHLLELQEKQRLKPDYTIVDGGRRAPSGQTEAWPNIFCHGDFSRR